MGIILFLFSFSEVLLPSGIQILKDGKCKNKQISIGLELSPNAKINYDVKGLFEKSGYNYFYLKNIDSAEALYNFATLLSQNKLFSHKNENGPTNLLRLVLKDFNGNGSPIINLTVGITGTISETKIINLFNKIPDTIISNSDNYYKLDRVVGKHIFPGKENFIANVSPSPFSEDFCTFLVFIRLMNNRNLRVRFSPETAPSPFIIYVSNDKIKNIALKPKDKEIKKAIRDVSNWINTLSLTENRSRFLVLSSSMGVEQNTFKNWLKELKRIESNDIKKVWKKYLLDGFVASFDSKSIKIMKKLFPESNIIIR
jgi:hypothetical protein